ncbi:hypothetical protein C0993_007325, partial [Termitomyces sp. T159_Od127]
YPLRNQPTGRSAVHRLSPTAIRNTGPLLRPEQTSAARNVRNGEATPRPHLEFSADSNPAVMPTAIGVDAAEPKASGNVGSMKNDGGSGKDDPEPSDDDHCMPSGENPEALLSEYNSFQNEPEEQSTFQEEGPEYDDWQSAPEETGDLAIQPTDKEEHDQEQDPDVFTQKDFADYLRDSGTLKRLLDRYNELEKLIRKVAEGSSKKAKYKPATKKTKNKNGRDRFTKPISQVSTKSALGRALAQLAPGPESSLSSSSESDPGDRSSSSDTNDSDSDSNSSSSDESEEERREKCLKCKQKHRKWTLIKPTAPKKYGGQADLRAFHKFLTHGTAYVKYGYVERR